MEFILCSLLKETPSHFIPRSKFENLNQRFRLSLKETPSHFIPRSKFENLNQRFRLSLKEKAGFKLNPAFHG